MRFFGACLLPIRTQTVMDIECYFFFLHLLLKSPCLLRFPYLPWLSSSLNHSGLLDHACKLYLPSSSPTHTKAPATVPFQSVQYDLVTMIHLMVLAFW
jgi:hypothetical protein